MYPTLYHAFLDLFGIELNFLKFFNSFGFFVALAFLAAHFNLASELRRKTANGLLKPTERKIMVGEGPKAMDLIMQAIVGFILGWKGLYIILNMADATADPPAFLLSTKGNIIGGVLMSAFFTWMLWREKKKEQLAKPEVRIVTLSPLQHAGNITLTAALWGFIGAKLFHWLENPRDFINLFNGAGAKDIVTGLTMYGGLILAGFMVMRYFKQNGLAFWPAVDSAAPSVLLAYGIGRIGCQVSGDGDWGIANTAPTPSWMPQWLWSYDYPNNVNGVLGLSRKGGYVGERITDGTCFEGYCTHLVPGVFPTPLYEAIACVLLFGVLWLLRKRINTPGIIFSLFLIFDGVERFFVEKIRVNEAWLGTWTQAEVISTVLTLAGLFGIWWFNTHKTDAPSEQTTAGL
ncbi:MAG: prolipoprotein diacylglyceryl transferase [Flavobacteriales bacterium]|nr:prolipoprotein diacylglyceryl transferase [Flavobacteriales bacterium]